MKPYIKDSLGRFSYYIAVYVNGRCVAQWCAGWFGSQGITDYINGVRISAKCFKKSSGVAAYCLASDGVYYLVSRDYGASCAPALICQELAQILNGMTAA